MTSEAELLSNGSDDEYNMETEISTENQSEKSSVTQSGPSSGGLSESPGCSTTQKNSSDTKSSDISEILLYKLNAVIGASQNIFKLRPWQTVAD